MKPTPPPEERGFLLSQNHTFDYAFDRAVLDVIGVDVQIDLQAEPGRGAQAAIGLGGQDGFGLTLLIGSDGRADFVMGAPDAATRVVGDPVPTSGLIRIRARWHTHGQLQLWVDGELRRYEPDFAVGAVLSIPNLAFRGSIGTVDPPPSRARRVAVKVLRRDDVADVLDRLLPIDPIVSAICARQMEAMTSGALALMREHMSATLARLTRKWSLGDAHAPFSDEAIAAHEAALAAGRAFALFMTGRDGAASEAFLARIGEFLAILAAADPEGYAVLIARLSALPSDLSPECRAALEPVAQANAAALAPINELLAKVRQIAESPGGARV